MLATSPVLAKEPKESKKKLKITRINKFPVGINRMSTIIQRNQQNLENSTHTPHIFQGQTTTRELV